MFGFGRGRRQASLNEYESRLVGNIQKFGWSCTTVFDPEEDQPGFSYSIGFTSSAAAPELIIFGLPGEIMHSMLSEAYRQIIKGKPVEEDSRWTGLIEGFDCVAKRVATQNVSPEYLNSAIWYWHHLGHDGLPPVFQLVWPGRLDGLYPWDPECSQEVRDNQPELWLGQ